MSCWLHFLFFTTDIFYSYKNFQTPASHFVNGQLGKTISQKLANICETQLRLSFTLDNQSRQLYSHRRVSFFHDLFSTSKRSYFSREKRIFLVSLHTHDEQNQKKTSQGSQKKEHSVFLRKKDLFRIVFI